LTDSKGDDVAARLESVALRLRHMLVLADPLGQLGGAKEWVLLFVDVLVGALVDGVVAVLREVVISGTFLVLAVLAIFVLAFGVLMLHCRHHVAVHEETETQVRLRRVQVYFVAGAPRAQDLLDVEVQGSQFNL